MALKEYSTQQMFRITKSWLDKLRPIIESSAELSGSLVIIKRAHEKLFSPAQAISETPDPLKAIQDTAKTTDLGHDRYARGSIYTLLAYASVSEEPQLVERYTKLSETLFPLGLETTLKTYEEEAGAVELLEKNLTPEIKQWLSELPVKGGGTLLDWVLAHVAYGKALGDLEDKKDDLKRTQAEAPVTTIPLGEARLFWIRAVNAFLQTVAIAEISEEDRESILAPVKKAEAVIERRKKGEEVADEDDNSEPTPGKD